MYACGNGMDALIPCLADIPVSKDSMHSMDHELPPRRLALRVAWMIRRPFQIFVSCCSTAVVYSGSNVCRMDRKRDQSLPVGGMESVLVVLSRVVFSLVRWLLLLFSAVDANERST